MYSTVLIERSALFRAGLLRLLENSHFRPVVSAAVLDDDVLAFAEQDKPALLLIGCEGGTGRAAAIDHFKKYHPPARIVALADQPDVNDAISVLLMGADAILSNVHSGDALINSLELVMQGATIVPTGTLLALMSSHIYAEGSTARLITEPAFSNIRELSASERRILSCLADGRPNKIIAREFNIAEATVKVHVKAILRKIGVQNRTQAAIWAVNNKATRSDLDLAALHKK